MLAGDPSKVPMPPVVVRPLVRLIARFMFKRVLRKAAFPSGFKAHKTMNPASGPATPPEGRIRLETAHQEFDEACRQIAAGGRPATTPFGSVSIQDLVRYNELHTRHHLSSLILRPIHSQILASLGREATYSHPPGCSIPPPPKPPVTTHSSIETKPLTLNSPPKYLTPHATIISKGGKPVCRRAPTSKCQSRACTPFF